MFVCGVCVCVSACENDCFFVCDCVYGVCVYEYLGDIQRVRVILCE